MPKIFISYRRADSRKDAGRLYDRLVSEFSKDHVFKDVDSIPMGKDFRGVLKRAVADCDVLLAIIGKQWLTIADEHGNRRLDNPNDFVRIEIESALQMDDCLVVPLLVDNAAAPPSAELPPDLRQLAFNNARVVRDDPDFHRDVDKLIAELHQYFGSAPAPQVTTNQPPYDVHAAISQFYRLFDERHWEAARECLAGIRNSGKAPRVFKVDTHEQEIWKALEAEAREREYDVLRLMVTAHRSPTTIWEAAQVFWQSFPDHDPDNLARFNPALAKPVRSTALSLLPKPFEWISIPAGRVTLVNIWADDETYIGKKGEKKTLPVAVFSIAKYPLTNDQFRLFIEAKGYDNQQWWTQAGWEVRQKEDWKEPRFWRNSKWNGDEFPIVGVSWYEAIAYCRWLSAVTGDVITLPTEQQWQRAAQGDGGQAFPWGDKWDASRCNNNVDGNGIGKTTPVRSYEGKGDSSFDVVDMAGNIWEWCLNDYQSGDTNVSGTGGRVLRGGSWNFNYAGWFRCTTRNWDSPDSRDGGRGFRLALS